MNGELYDQHNEVPVNRKDRRSLSFSHSRFHRRNSSSEEDDESPVRNAYFHGKFNQWLDNLIDHWLQRNTTTIIVEIL